MLEKIITKDENLLPTTNNHNLWEEIIKDVSTGLPTTLIIYHDWYVTKKKWINILTLQEIKKEEKLAKKEGRKPRKITPDMIEAEYPTPGLPV